MADETCVDIRFNSVNMGDNKTFHESGNGSSFNNKGFVYGATNWRYFITDKRPKRTKKKMDAKFVILRCLDILGISWGALSIFSVINNVKEALLFLVLLIYSGVRIYYIIQFNENRNRKEKYEQKQREQLNGKHLNK